MRHDLRFYLDCQGQDLKLEHPLFVNFSLINSFVLKQSIMFPDTFIKYYHTTI